MRWEARGSEVWLTCLLYARSSLIVCLPATQKQTSRDSAFGVVLHNLYSQKRTSCSVSSPFSARYQTLLGYRAEQFQSLSLKSLEYADGVRQVQDRGSPRWGHRHRGGRSQQPAASTATHQGGRVARSCCSSDFLKNTSGVAGTVARGTHQSRSWQETDNLSHLQRVN